MTRIVLTLVLVFSASLIQIDIARADVLLIEEVRQSDQLNLPTNGMNRDEVQARYGKPLNKLDAVGDPPITQWKYGSWSVYFEYDLVLFTVLHKGAVIDKSNRSDS